MNRYLQVNSDGVVINIVIWDGETPYAPSGCTLMPCADHPQVSFGWQLINGNWQPPTVDNPDEIE